MTTLSVNERLRLESSERVIAIEKGSIDLFGVSKENELFSFYLGNFESGELIFDVGLNIKTDFYLEARPIEDSVIRERPLAEIWQEQAPLLNELAEYLKKILTIFKKEKRETQKTIFPTLNSFELKKGESAALFFSLELKKIAHLFWLKIEKGQIKIYGQEEKEQSTMLPCLDHISLSAIEDSTLKLEDKISIEDFHSGLARFYSFYLTGLCQEKKKREALQKQQWQENLELDKHLLSSTEELLADIVNKQKLKPLFSTDHLFRACQIIGKEIGVEFLPIDRKGSVPKDIYSHVKLIAETSQVRYKRAKIEKSYFQRDIGPILAFRTQEMKPVAIIPKKRKGFLIFNPENDELRPLEKNDFDELKEECYFFYKNFPNKASLLQSMAYGLENNSKDLTTIIFSAILSSLMSLFLPISIGWIFDIAIPTQSLSLLWQITIGLLSMAIGVSLATLTQLFAFLRLNSKMGYKIKSGLWGRLLSLKLSFFRKSTAGDLFQRVSAIDEIRQQMSGYILLSSISAILSVGYFLVMFIKSAKLALLTAIPIIIGTIIYSIGIYFNVKKSLVSFNLKGKIYAFLVQVLNGIAKIRSAGAENRVFAQWAKMFSTQKKVDISVSKINLFMLIAQNLFSYSALFIMYFFVVMALKEAIKNKTDPMQVGVFISFSTALGGFLTTGFSFALTFIQSFGKIIPLWKRSEIIREAEPEITEKKELPGELLGNITAEHIFFRYGEESQILLHDISFEIQAGEFVAIVGPSGCGKSTLVKLLLGLETTEKGKIYYDGKDLERLDIIQLRKQIGSVLQGSILLGGPLRDNITCGRSYTDEEIKEVLKITGFTEDLRNLPMGLNTLIPMGGSTVSGGQRQKIMLARALLSHPKILILDEATSALDNISQEIVTKSLENLNITRIVIAHRLSTIINADTIYVMDKGRIVQKGSFEDLKNEESFFRPFIEKQMPTNI